MLESWLIAWWVLFLGLSWYPCCCGGEGGGEPCTDCIDNNTTRYMTVVISGFANTAVCSDCPDLDGTYVLEQSELDVCGWILGNNGPVCGVLFDVTVYTLQAAGYYWNGRVNFQGETCDSTNRYFPGKVDCANADGTGYHLLSYETSSPNFNAYCDATSIQWEVYSGDTT